MKKIHTYQFRNLFPQELDLFPSINLFLGGNGEGKTNLLEAIYVLGRGRSFRAPKEEELVAWNKKSYSIKGTISSLAGEGKLEIIGGSLGKEALFEGIKIDSLRQLGTYLNLVIFVPEDLQLVKGGPSWRRRFLDEEISQLHASYGEELLRYQQVLKERNNHLKDKKRDKSLMAVFDEQLISYGSNIIEKRIKVIERLNPLVRLMNRRLSDMKEELILAYRSFFKVEKRMDKRAIKDIFTDMLSQRRKEELFRGITLVGPHRDDMEMKMNRMNLRDYGSQGQQRTAVLSLKLAQIELFKAKRGEYPILLLDDVFSELDTHRCLKVRELLGEKIQSIMTTTSMEDVKGIFEGGIFLVKGGQIKREV